MELKIKSWLKCIEGNIEWSEIYTKDAFFYHVILLCIILGLIAVFITITGSFNAENKDIEKSNIKHFLISPTFLSFIIAVVILYISRSENTMFTESVLPFGSWIVPILSYFNGKNLIKGKNSQNNYIFLFSGAIFSFLLGFIFGLLSFELPYSIEFQIHPVHYPFMSSSWIIIASYMYLLDSKLWNPGYIMNRVESFCLNPLNKLFIVIGIILIGILSFLFIFL